MKLLWFRKPSFSFKRLLWGFLSIQLLALAALSVGCYFFLRPYYLRAQHYDLTNLDEFNVTTLFYDRNGEEIGKLFVEDRTLLKHDDIPDLMRHAVVAAEDRRFYLHHGVDFQGFIRALYIDLRTRKLAQGGSTITQQLAKHLIGNFEKSIDRKLVEAFLARRIEHVHSKAEILDYYLNRIYFGRGYYGLAAAAQGYFGKKAQDLNTSECAALAALIKAPSAFSPRKGLAAATKRRNIVIELMAEQHFLSSDEATEALADKLTLVLEKPSRPQSYFMSLAIKELHEVLHVEEDQELPQGLSVQTTLDAHLQHQAEVDAIKQINEVEAKTAPPKQGEETGEEDQLQAAALAMDLHSGAIRVLLGGRDYNESSFDRARMARRENGALLQPFLYSLAFERLDLTPASMINASFLDTVITGTGEAADPLSGTPGPGKYYLTIEDALALSNKACATRVGLKLGMANFVDWLSSAGIKRSKQSESESSWGLEPLTLKEVTSLYQMLGNDGIQTAPYAIERVVSEQGETLYQNKNQEKRLLDPMVARQMTLTLQSATRSGSASSLVRDYNFASPVAGMTGYSEGYRDAWFVGYTPTMVTGVWMGYDKSLPIGPKTIATKTALPLWGDIMEATPQTDSEHQTFVVPPSFTKVEVDRRSGLAEGPGFLTPDSGNILIYLREGQTNQLIKETSSAKVEQPKDWSDWLSTMYANPTEDSQVGMSLAQAPEGEEGLIPQVADYRLPALRGDILSADGEIFATMREAQGLVLSWPAPDVVSGEDEVVRWVQKKLALAQDWLKQDLDLANLDLLSQFRYKRFHPILVCPALTAAQVADFSKSQLAQEGFSLQGYPSRVYPQGKTLSQVLGYLKRVQGRSFRKYEAGEVIYDDYRGAAGLEEAFDKDLRGQDGKFLIETSPDGFAQSAVVKAQATAGGLLRLTIDAKLQACAERAMAGIEVGAAVVMNVHNGDLLAMVSRPSIDPNEFLPGLSSARWQELMKDEKNPLLDRVYRQQNPPGSTFKIITSIASMEAGVFDADREVVCPGFFQVGNVRYNLPDEKATVSYREALARSFNTYFFDLGLRIGRENLIKTAQEFGVGKATGFMLPGELSGMMPTNESVRLAHQRSMGPGDVTNAAIGQGDVLMTPLQWTVALSAIANGGTFYRPRLVQQVENPVGQVQKSFPTEIRQQITLPPQTPKLVEAMQAVVEEGTAQSAQIPGVKIAAKTGTAQVGSKLKPRQIAWLVGFLPADNPQYAFAVMIEGNNEQDLHGGSSAGPVAAKIFSELLAKPTTKIEKETP